MSLSATGGEKDLVYERAGGMKDVGIIKSCL